MRMRRGVPLSDLAWWLAVLGAILLMASTLSPTSTVPPLLLIGCALAALGAATYGLSRLRVRWSRRHGP
jgi:hypothetical protein